MIKYKQESNVLWLLIIIIATTYLVLPFAPVITFFISVSSLFLIKQEVRVLRFVLYPPVLISLVLISISRDLFITFKDDYQTYFDYYISLLNGEGGGRFGIELGLLGLNYLIGSIFGELAPRALLFLYVLLQFFLLICFLEMLIKKVNFRGYANVFVASVIAFAPLLAFTVTIRQNISLLILSIAIIHSKRLNRLIYVALAFIFHLSALPILVLHKSLELLIEKKFIHVAIYFSIVIVSILFLSQYFLELPKFRAFVEYDLSFEFLQFFLYYKFIFVGLFLSFYFNGCKTSSISKYSICILCLAFMLDWVLPYISFRVFQLQIMFAGLLLFFAFYFSDRAKWKEVVYSGFFFVLFIFKVALLMNGEGDFSFFNSFPWGDSEPFYYFDSIFEDIYERKR